MNKSEKSAWEKAVTRSVERGDERMKE